MGLTDFRRRGLAAAYLGRRLLLRGEPQRFAPSPSPAFRADVPAEQGVVDGVHRGSVRGWARRLDRPSAAVSVDVYLDDDYLGRADCGLKRADLAQMDGFHDGRCGFAFSLPERALRRGGDLRVFAAASGLELSGGPLRVEGWHADEPGARDLLQVAADLRAPLGGATSLGEISAAYGRRLDVLTERDPSYPDTRFPVTRGLAYFNARYHRGALPCRGARAYCELLLLAAEHFAPALAGLPMRAEHVEALVAPTGQFLGGRVQTHVLIDQFLAAEGLALPKDDDDAADVLVRFVMQVLVGRRLPLELLGESATRYLREPAAGGTRFLHAFAASYLFAAARAGEDHRLVRSMARATAVHLGLGELVGEGAAVAEADEDTPHVAGVRVISGDYGANGLSNNARQSARALQHLGVPTLLSSAPVLRSQAPAVFAELGTPVYETVLLHVQPDDAVEVLLRLPRAQAQARLIGFFVWETETLPAAHALGVLLVDEVWTASDYCSKAIAAAAPGTPVAVVGHAVDEAPTAFGWDARAWAGAGAGDFLVLFHFDAHAWITRKNPVAVVRAFREAFAGGERDVRLLIKVRHADEAVDHQQQDRWVELAEEAGQDLRIRIANEDLDGAHMAALTAAADVFISLHRSEGFGYGVAEAMLAGKPVVVSDYGGSADFASADEALLVPVQRRRLSPGEFLYGDPSQVWGEPDVHAAAAALRALYDDRTLGARLGAAARRRMIAEASVQRLAERYAEQLRPPGVATPTASALDPALQAKMRRLTKGQAA